MIDWIQRKKVPVSLYHFSPFVPLSAMCWLCGDDDKPVKGDKFPSGRQFKTTMCKAPCKDPGCFCLSCLCPCCAQYTMRKQVLGGGDVWQSRYMCCQGMFGSCCCFKPGKMGEKKCPACCLCLEATCCHSCAVSATRWTVMADRGLKSDPCDIKIIRCNNCVQIASCICSCLAIIVPECREVASCLRLIADCIYCTVQACMTTQVHYELENEDAMRDAVKGVPQPAHAPPTNQMY